MILAVVLIVTDSACSSAQAHQFPFRCNDLKLFDARSVLAMDEKQSLALWNCRLKKEHVPGLGAVIQPEDGDRMVANESLTIELFVDRSHGMQWARRSESKGQKGFPNCFNKFISCRSMFETRSCAT